MIHDFFRSAGIAEGLVPCLRPCPLVLDRFPYLRGEIRRLWRTLSSQGHENVRCEPTRPRDHYGDPLPSGVRFRLGTVRLRHDGDVMALAWMPDGRTLASASWDRTVRLWQIPGGKQLAQWDNLEGVVFSSDGRTLACGEGENRRAIEAKEERAIRIVDVATGKERRHIRVSTNGRSLFNFTPGYALGVFSPDGKIFAVREGESGVRLYSVDSGKELRLLKAKVLVYGRPIMFSPDSRTLLVATDEGVYRWTIGTGAKRKSWPTRRERSFPSPFPPMARCWQQWPASTSTSSRCEVGQRARSYAGST